MAGDIWLVESQGLPVDYFRRMLSAVASTPAQACTEMVRHTLDPARMVVVVVGDADKIKADLETIATVTVVKDAAGDAPVTQPAEKTAVSGGAPPNGE